MSKFSFPYRATATVYILLFCITILLMNGCSKKDQSEKQTTEIVPVPPSTFFTVPSSTDPLVTTIVNSLQRQDIKGDIESQLVHHAGLPKWDKAMIAGSAITAAGKGETGVTDSEGYTHPICAGG